ncbi:MAG: hypothetical protein JWR61_2402 [Ferruginibacter sp.]|nr:hypothetical protein [Ferruginibacter sp.]
MGNTGQEFNLKCRRTAHKKAFHRSCFVQNILNGFFLQNVFTLPKVMPTVTLSGG